MTVAVPAGNIATKRIYEKPATGDGKRVLVDGLWPRGVRKEDAKLDEWLREIAPDGELRRWFDHDLARWDEFRRRYRAQLADQQHAIDRLRRIARAGKLTLLYGARDERHNNALVLRNILLGRPGP